MAGTREDVKFRGHADFAEAGVEAFALHEGDLVVLIAVDDQERRIVFGDVVQRADLAGAVGAVADDAAEEFRAVGGGEVGVGFAGAGDVDGHCEHVACAVEIDYGTDAAGDGFAGGGGCGTDDTREVAARGAARNGEALGVEAIVGCAGAEPTDRGARVVDLRGPLGGPA